MMIISGPLSGLVTLDSWASVSESPSGTWSSPWLAVLAQLPGSEHQAVTVAIAVESIEQSVVDKNKESEGLKSRRRKKSVKPRANASCFVNLRGSRSFKCTCTLWGNVIMMCLGVFLLGSSFFGTLWVLDFLAVYFLCQDGVEWRRGGNGTTVIA